MNASTTTPANTSEPDSRALRRRSRAVKTQLRTLDDLDGRTWAAKRAKQLVGAITSDLGGDLSAAQAELAQRAGLLAAYLEDAETRWLAGQDVDVASYLAAINVQRRCLLALGLRRVPRDATPSLSEYLAQRAREAAEERAREDAQP